MFGNMMAFNGMFGKVESGLCRLTTNGNIAVKCSNGYKTYNVAKDTLTNVSNFCFNVGDDMFFVIPTSKVEKGDIILSNGKPRCVKEIDKKTITVINYENNTVETIMPERHVFMGSAYFYGKIISPFGNMFKGGKGLGKMLKTSMMMQMMSQMMNNGNVNENSRGNNNFMSSMGNMGNMMMLPMMMGAMKGESMFDGMFDFDMDGDILDEDDTKVTDTEKEA